jgi:hypothetical protein
VTWVRRCESVGESINGNVIYQTLAEHVRNPCTTTSCTQAPC